MNPTTPTPDSPPPPDNAAAAFERDRLFRLSLDLLCISGFDGYLKQVNPSWTRILGWSEHELLSRPVIDFLHPDDRGMTLQARAELTEGQPSVRLENRYRCKDGSYRWFSWQSVVADDDRTVFGIARDVTEQRQAHELKAMTDKLESTALLAGGLAHDFNNLLASLILNLDLIGHYGPLQPEQATLLSEAQQSADAAKTLIWKLLSLTHGGVVHRETLPLGPLITEVAEAFRGSGPQRLTLSMPPDLALVSIDRTRIRDVLVQLLTNAREAMPPDGVVSINGENLTLAPGNLLKLNPGPYARVRVVDNGCGISSRNLPRVFDPYFSTKSRGVQKGMGLGLTLCLATAKQHGGSLTVSSRPGQGTTVELYLPVASDADSAEHP